MLGVAWPGYGITSIGNCSELEGMGTELQYAVNLLASLSTKKADAVTTVAEAADSWSCSQKRLLTETIKTCFNQFQESMDRFLEQFSGESVRTTMLKQDEIFKEQVRELHRLYRVQQMLMTELRSDTKLHMLPNSSSPGEIPVVSNCMNVDNRTGFPTTGAVSLISHPHNKHGSIQTNSTTNLHPLYNIRENLSSAEQSSSFSGNTFRLKRGFDLEQPAKEDNCTDNSAVEVLPTFSQRSLKGKIDFGDLGDTHFSVENESEIELTLSIGHCTDKRKQKHWPRSKLEMDCSESTHNETRQLIPSTSV